MTLEDTVWKPGMEKWCQLKDLQQDLMLERDSPIPSSPSIPAQVPATGSASIPIGRACPQCGNAISAKAIFCPSCNHRFDGIQSKPLIPTQVPATGSTPISSSKACPQCGNAISAKAIFCPSCNHRFDGIRGKKGMSTGKKWAIGIAVFVALGAIGNLMEAIKKGDIKLNSSTSDNSGKKIYQSLEEANGVLTFSPKTGYYGGTITNKLDKMLYIQVHGEYFASKSLLHSEAGWQSGWTVTLKVPARGSLSFSSEDLQSSAFTDDVNPGIWRGVEFHGSIEDGGDFVIIVKK
jgi:RNA polymerase subunit RPABC4/transcription elongation factor Spt4